MQGLLGSGPDLMHDNPLHPPGCPRTSTPKLDGVDGFRDSVTGLTREQGRQVAREFQDCGSDRGRFELPSEVSFRKERLGDGWAFVSWHQTLGKLGRILLQDILDLQDSLGHEDPRTSCNYIRDGEKLHRNPAYVGV
jgi:hypothetical protein